MAVLDALWVKLGFQTDTKGLEEFQKKAFDVKKALTEIAEVVAVAKIGEWIKGTVERLADVQKLSEVLQMPARSIAALNKVAAENEVPVEAMQSTMETLTRTAGQAALGIGRGAMIFQKLGLHAKDAHGNVKGFNELLGDVADKLQGKSRTEQLGIAGRLGIDEHLLNVLSQGRAKIQELTDAAEKSNPLSGKDYENALQTEKLMVKTRASITAVSNQIAVKLLPTIDRALTAFTAWFSQARHSDAFATLIRVVIDLAADIGHVVGAITNVIGAFAKWGPGATILKNALAVLIGMKFAGWIGSVAEKAGTATSAIKKMATETGGFKKMLTSGLLGVLFLVVEDLWGFYHGSLSVTGVLVSKWAPALTLIQVALGVLATAFVALKVQALSALLPIGVEGGIAFGWAFIAVAAVAALIYGLYQLKKHWTEVSDAIAGGLNAMIDKINKVREAFGFGDIEHIVTYKELTEKQQKLSEFQGSGFKRYNADGDTDFLKKRPAHTVQLSSGRVAAVHSSGLHALTNNAPHINTTNVTVQKVEIKTNNPEEMGKQFHRQVTRNAQSRTVL